MMPDNLAEWVGCAFWAAMILFEALYLGAAFIRGWRRGWRRDLG